MTLDVAAPARTHAAPGALLDSPWTRSDVQRSGGWAGIGLIALAVCCVGVSRTRTYDDQLLWAGLGAIALAVAVLGGVRWILRGLRTVRRERRDVMVVLGGLTADVQAAPVDVAGTAVYFTPAMSRFHTGTCPFVRGKNALAVARHAQHELGSRRPCEVCAP